MKNVKALIFVSLFAISGLQAGSFVSKAFNTTGSLLNQNKMLISALAVWGAFKTEKVQNFLKDFITLNTTPEEVNTTAKSIIGVELFNLAANKSSRLNFLQGHSQRILASFVGYKVWNSAWLTQLYNTITGNINNYVLPYTNKIAKLPNIEEWTTNKNASKRAQRLSMIYSITGFVPTIFSVGNKSLDVLSNYAGKVFTKTA